MKIVIAASQKAYFEAMQIRGRVFVDEQKVPSAIEIDELDQTCLHVLLYDNNQPKAVLRLIEHDQYYQVGRVAVLPENRGKGYGKALMLGIEQLDAVQAKKQLRLDAQMQAIGFYENLGYQIEGEPFLEADILHRHAVKNL